MSCYNGNSSYTSSAKKTISETSDQVKWALEKNGNYTTRSMYRALSNRWVLNQRMKALWRSKLPMKIKVFMWLTFQDRLPTGGVLKKINWKGEGVCKPQSP